MERLQHRISELLAENEARISVGEMTLKLEDSQTEVAGLKEKVSSLLVYKQQCESLQMENKILTDDYEKLQKEVSVLRIEHQAQRESLTYMEHMSLQLDYKASQVDELTATVDRLQEDNALYKLDLEVARERLLAARQNVAELEVLQTGAGSSVFSQIDKTSPTSCQEAAQNLVSNDLCCATIDPNENYHKFSLDENLPSSDSTKGCCDEKLFGSTSKDSDGFSLEMAPSGGSSECQISADVTPGAVQETSSVEITDTKLASSARHRDYLSYKEKTKQEEFDRFLDTVAERCLNVSSGSCDQVHHISRESLFQLWSSSKEKDTQIRDLNIRIGCLYLQLRQKRAENNGQFSTELMQVSRFFKKHGYSLDTILKSKRKICSLMSTSNAQKAKLLRVQKLLSEKTREAARWKLLAEIKISRCEHSGKTQEAARRKLLTETKNSRCEPSGKTQEAARTKLLAETNNNSQGHSGKTLPGIYTTYLAPGTNLTQYWMMPVVMPVLMPQMSWPRPVGLEASQSNQAVDMGAGFNKVQSVSTTQRVGLKAPQVLRQAGGSLSQSHRPGTEASFIKSDPVTSQIKADDPEHSPHQLELQSYQDDEVRHTGCLHKLDPCGQSESRILREQGNINALDLTVNTQSGRENSDPITQPDKETLSAECVAGELECVKKEHFKANTSSSVLGGPQSYSTRVSPQMILKYGGRKGSLLRRCRLQVQEASKHEHVSNSTVTASESSVKLGSLGCMWGPTQGRILFPRLEKANAEVAEKENQIAHKEGLWTKAREVNSTLSRTLSLERDTVIKMKSRMETYVQRCQDLNTNLDALTAKNTQNEHELKELRSTLKETQKLLDVCQEDLAQARSLPDVTEKFSPDVVTESTSDSILSGSNLWRACGQSDTDRTSGTSKFLMRVNSAPSLPRQHFSTVSLQSVTSMIDHHSALLPNAMSCATEPDSPECKWDTLSRLTSKTNGCDEKKPKRKGLSALPENGAESPAKQRKKSGGSTTVFFPLDPNGPMYPPAECRDKFRLTSRQMVSPPHRTELRSRESSSSSSIRAMCGDLDGINSPEKRPQSSKVSKYTPAKRAGRRFHSRQDIRPTFLNLKK
ncbi:hypothetical protein ElyMa_000793600 [Elysia marginata]|uniref:Uncharacterized protein n=1 Tax=Elysia marginata TaxID=1093978 RepID=A0AAV4GVF8_9GAST|nr:hypothetical protein ElyMa_000793600 [Elysia marginata]